MKTFLLFSLATILAVISFAQQDDSAMEKRIVDETMTNATAYTTEYVKMPAPDSQVQ